MNTIENLRDRISVAAKFHQFGTYEIRYLPSDAVERLVSSGVVNSALQRDSEKLSFNPPNNRILFANHVSTQARRIFLMCIYADLDMKYLHELLQWGLSDANITPFSRSGSEWTQLRTADWIFEPMKLRNYTFGTIVPRAGPLPMVCEINPDTNIGTGSSGNVRAARFLSQYCEIPNLDHDPIDPSLTERCALKKIGIEKGAEDCVKNEQAFATWLASSQLLMNDAHITKTFLEFEIYSRHYLVSELAAKSLYHLFWEDRPAAYDSAWFRKQIIGLTRALSKIHGSILGKTGSHNDIQPANILFFPDQGDTLKFTDWGRTKLNETTGSPPDPPCNDVLYLGCVFVGLLMWVYGSRESVEYYDTAFDWHEVYPLNPTTGILETSGQALFIKLRQQFPDIHGVIEVIYHMVNGRSAGCISASEALRRFEAISGPW